MNIDNDFFKHPIEDFLLNIRCEESRKVFKNLHDWCVCMDNKIKIMRELIERNTKN